ncbi:protein translocase subunit [Perilla frutescens var. hirtella]|nr:protein translocase subunit [Perilla frutescens var. hirtella]KAH6810204.1 protein translocase subunit [Perilla frutescens var. frutescens]
MGFGALRSIIRPVSRILSPASHFSPAAKTFSTTPPPQLRHLFAPLRRDIPWIPPRSAFHSLTDTRYPKRRPVDKPRRKRTSLKPPGPYTWVKSVPGEPILPNQPNEGSLKRRNEKKRIKQHRAFIKSERKKRTVLIQEAKRKKLTLRVERKMAAVARERAWAERLVELKRIEEEKKAAMS